LVTELHIVRVKGGTIRKEETRLVKGTNGPWTSSGVNEGHPYHDVRLAALNKKVGKGETARLNKDEKSQENL